MLYTYQRLNMYNWVGLYEKPFFAQLATEDACAVGVAYIATFVESFYGKCVGTIRNGIVIAEQKKNCPVTSTLLLASHRYLTWSCFLLSYYTYNNADLKVALYIYIYIYSCS